MNPTLKTALQYIWMYVKAAGICAFMSISWGLSALFLIVFWGTPLALIYWVVIDPETAIGYSVLILFALIGIACGIKYVKKRWSSRHAG